jgi:phosphohistidine swiveling domain-containing protein
VTAVVPVDEYITEEWYPGFKPGDRRAPFVVEPFGTFTKADEQRFWFLDFHWPRGLTPLGLIWNEDGYSWGSQLAAERMPLPPGRGITQRIAGTHTYAGAIPVEDPGEMRDRAGRLRGYLSGFLRDFEQIWAQRVAELEAWWQRLQAVDVAAASLDGLAVMLADARGFHRRAFEIHFELMYPLLVNYRGFCGVCTELDIDPAEIGKFLQGRDTRIMQTDRQLGALTAAARRAGLAPVFAATEPERLAGTLTAAGGTAGAWMSRFGDFLQEFGYRTEGPSDVALPSWIEDPTPALGMIKTLLQKQTDHEFGEARRQAQAERDAAIDAARSRLTRAEQQVFDDGLASVQAANFPWWQDEHNYYIDLRVSLPLRWAALAIADRVGADRPDDTVFLSYPELARVAAGELPYRGVRGLVTERRAYFEHWRDRRASMPKVLGTVPDTVQDPILVEIFGLNRNFLTAVTAAATSAEVRTLTGIAASGGRASGPARVLSDADDLHRVGPGEVLVCESTSPNWTPAFAKIAACVCDGGGMLSHAAIVGREYRVPTVTACGVATVTIRDGDLIEVDGDKGVVTVLRRGPGGG